MPEIDMRNNPWNPGIPIDSVTVAHDLYILLAIFASSSELSQRRNDENDEVTVYGYSLRNFELPEVGRILVSLAASCRNEWDYRSNSIEDQLSNCGKSTRVGTLLTDKDNPSSAKDLKIRESWSKIIHCHTMNFHRSKGPSIFSGHLEPFVHLYGEYQGHEWKATIEIYEWCEVMHCLT